MEEQYFEVWTANESGFTDYHEENDETDDYEVAVAWLDASDCIRGHIKLNGVIVASKDEDGWEFREGWTKRGYKG